MELAAPLTFTPKDALVCLSGDTASPGDRVTVRTHLNTNTHKFNEQHCRPSPQVLGWHRGGGSLVVGAAEEVPINPCRWVPPCTSTFPTSTSIGKA